jgi:hypothetical protein
MARTDSIDSRYQEIIHKIDVIIKYLEELVEDPIFIDSIHGEQEMALDLSLELMDTIKSQFEPEVAEDPFHPLVADESFDNS